MAYIAPHNHQFVTPTATPAEVLAGTRDDVAITPLGLAQSGVDFGGGSSTPLIAYEFSVIPGTTSVNLAAAIGGNYVIGKVNRVLLNGVELSQTTEWTATNGTTVNLTSAISEADLPPAETNASIKIYYGGSEEILSSFDARYIPKTQIGRDVGDVVGLESYIGAPAIFTNGGLRVVPGVSDGNQFANLIVMKDIPVGADPGPVSEPNPAVNFNLLVKTDIRESMRSFQWNGIFQTEIHPGVYRKYDHGDEPVVLGATLTKWGDIPAWCLYTSTEDLTTNPVFATLGWELGFKVNGPDPNDRRIVIDAQLNSIDDRPGYNKYGNNEIAAFINISPSLGEPERVILKRGIVMKGRVGVAIDLTETTAYSRENIALPPGGFLSWKANPGAAYNARFGWTAGIGWQMHGFAESVSASSADKTLPANPTSFAAVEVSPGVIRKIALYLP